MLRFLKTVVLVLVPILSFGQSFEADLGEDRKLCQGYHDEVLEAEITGGVQPFSYVWTIVENWIVTTDVLSDRYVESPELIGGTYPTPTWGQIDDHISDWATVRVQVTDANGDVAQDEMELLVCEHYLFWEPSYKFVEVGDTMEFRAFADQSCAGNVVGWEATGCTILGYPSEKTVEVLVTTLDPQVQVNVNDPIGCDIPNLSIFPSVVVVYPAGVEEKSELSFKVHPNPSSGSFTISKLKMGSDVVVFNSVGAMMLERTAISSKMTIENRLSPGVYFIQVSQNRKTETIKLMVTP